MSEILRPNRRRFLGMAGATSAATLLRLERAAAQATGVFRHGVASGDPLADRVIIWTRVTPSDGSAPGSATGPPVDVGWEVARDSGFTDVIASGTVTTTRDRDHTVKLDAAGLDAGSDHWYRFTALGETSPAGRARTLPAPGVTPDCVRLGIVSCAEWEFGFFGAYRLLAERDDIDAVVHMGDYIYEFGEGYGPAPTPGSTFGRVHDPTHETVTLEDYRVRYGQYRTDAGAQAMHAAHPIIAMYDDHEITNDTWREGAQNHDESEGDFFARARVARQAWREWMPIREDPTDPELAHRAFRFGDLAELWMVDERRFRDAPPQSGAFSLGSTDPAINDPNRSMLGVPQRDWLMAGMASTPAAWKVMGSPVPMIPQNVGPEISEEQKIILGPLLEPLPVTRPAYYVDDWNGYVGERNIMFDFFDTLDDVVVLSGDFHESFASDLPASVGDYAVDGRSVAAEFTCPAVTSPGNSETLALSGAPIEITQAANIALEANFATSNQWVKYHEGFENGFGVVEFTTEKAHYDFHHLADRTDPNTTSTVATSWQSLRGADAVTPAGGPLEPRARDERPPAAVVPTTIAPAPPATPLPATGGRSQLPAAAAATLAALGGLAAARQRPARPPVEPDR